MSEVRPDKYFLAFGFRGKNQPHFTLKEYHITLAYFGAEGNAWLISDIEKVVDDFFKEWTTCPITISFEEVAMFGPNKNIRVLLPFEKYAKNYLLPLLRGNLIPFLGGAIYPFNPHLTTNDEYFCGTVDKLYLCKNGYEILKEWSL